MSLLTPTTGRAAMPAPGSKKAPPTFNGDEQLIAEFLEIYERCVDDAQLPQADWVPFFFRYLSRSQCDIFEAFEGVEPPNWDTFKESIQESFAGAFKSKKFTLAALDTFIKQSALQPISSDSAMRTYHCHFQAITSYLIKEKELAGSDRDRQYWFGLHPHSRLAIEQRLAITMPDHPRSKPYMFSDVYKAGCYVFDANAFDLSLPQMTLPRPGTDATHQTASRVVQTTVQLPTPGIQTGGDDLSTLVQCLASLKVNDIEYATTYAHLMVNYPQLAGVVAKPAAFATTTGQKQSPPINSMQRICGFCRDINCPSRSTRYCPVGQSYIQANKIIQVDGWYRWPDNSRIDTHPQGLKFVVDKTLEDKAKHAVEAATTMPHHSLYFEVNPAPAVKDTPTSAYIEEVASDDEVTRTYHAYQVALAAQKERSEASACPLKDDAKLEPEKRSGQFHYKTKVEDPDVAQRLYDRAMGATISVTPGELLAVSPDLRKLFVESCKVNRIPVYSVTSEPVSHSCHAASLVAQVTPLYTAPIMELDVKLAGKHPEVGLYDTGAELVCISAVAAKELKLPFNPDRKLCMRDANGGTKTTFGVVENLNVQINGISVLVHAWIIDNAPYRLLLGRPFQLAANADTEEAGDVLVIEDPGKTGHRLRIPMRPHTNTQQPHSLFLSTDAVIQELLPSHSAVTVQAHGVVPPSLIPHLSSVASPLSRSYFADTYEWTVPALGLRYKTVDRKVRPVPTTLPEAARPKRRFPDDPLNSLSPMNRHPPSITTYGQRLTKERWEALQVLEKGFLWQEEVNLAFDVLMKNEGALAWDDTEKGRFRDDYFAPIVVPTIEHEPWTLKNIPVPPGLRDPVIKFIKEKIASGTYEPSGSSYRSRWFCVPRRMFRLIINHKI